MVKVAIALFLFPLIGFSQLSDREILDLKRNSIKEDTSYVYWLPYESGKKYLLVQAANSKLSHKNELSADFKMKIGTSICAARAGLVIDVKTNSDVGGLKTENISDGNFIIIQHQDGSIAKYWHLSVNGTLVSLGDNVKKGQVIAKSGNTGYSAFPHLHFQITDRYGKQLLPRFYTRKGIKYLKPGKWYTAVHEME